MSKVATHLHDVMFNIMARTGLGDGEFTDEEKDPNKEHRVVVLGKLVDLAEKY